MFLEDLRMFLRIVELKGMAAAGRDLGLSRAKVSERLVALEHYYGARLLTRTTRAIGLTDEGRALVEGAQRMLAEADETKVRIRRGVEMLSGTIRVSATADLGRHCIGPAIDQFLLQHPEVAIDMTLTDGHVDLVSQGIDLAVRLGTLADSTLRSRVVAVNRRIVCAAPAYLKAYGAPKAPDDLARHNCIVMRFGREIDNQWTFVIDGKARRVRVSGNRIANDGDYVRSWALAGHGVVLKSIWDVAADLKSGSLVQVLEEFSSAESSVQLVYPQGAVQPRRVRALMDHLADWFSSRQAKLQ